jgi:hypothetical protein
MTRETSPARAKAVSFRRFPNLARVARIVNALADAGAFVLAIGMTAVSSSGTPAPTRTCPTREGENRNDTPHEHRGHRP